MSRRFKCKHLVIEIADYIAVVILGVSAIRKVDILWAEYKDILPINSLNRRTFPHFPEILIAFYLKLTGEIIFSKNILRRISYNPSLFILSLRAKENEIFL